MLKIFIYLVVVAILVIGGLSWYHLQKVAAKNKTELANFEGEVKFNADLGKVLVVYYSLTGHTKDIAEQIAAKTGADLFEIKTKEVYSSPSVYMISKKELTSKQYPEINAENMPNISEYDTIFVGGPVWWYTMAPAVYSYLQMTDFNSKRVVPFSTQGSNFGSFFKDFEAMAKNAQIMPSENFNNVSEEYAGQVANKINAWLNKIAE